MMLVINTIMSINKLNLKMFRAKLIAREQLLCD